MRRLHADRCTLEPLVRGHAPELFSVLGDPAIYEFENAPPESLPAFADRCARLESRRSADGTEQWLNWVLRLADGALCGYVQATVRSDGLAYVAYELGSRCWRQGIGSNAVGAMIAELGSEYGVRTFVAVLKASNHRSIGLLRKLGFDAVARDAALGYGAGSDELAMVKAACALSS